MKSVLRAFSFRGRSGRGTYWVTNVALNIAAYAVALAGLLLGPSQAAEVIVGVAAVVALVVTIWIGSAMMVRRGHDRGRPAILSIALFFTVQLSIIAIRSPELRGLIPAAVAPFALLLVVAALGWQVIEYGFWPGQPRANRYGSPARYSAGDKTPPLVLGT